MVKICSYRGKFMVATCGNMVATCGNMVATCGNMVATCGNMVAKYVQKEKRWPLWEM